MVRFRLLIDSKALSRLPALAAVAVTYFIVARLGLLVSLDGSNATPIWPASGLAAAALLLRGPSMAAAVFVGALLANGTTLPGPFGWLAAACIAIGNSAEALITWYICSRWFRGALFASAESVYVFLSTIALAAAVAALVGASALVAAGLIDADLAKQAGTTWWLGDITGLMIVTPLLVGWREIRSMGWRSAELLVPFALAVLLSFGTDSADTRLDRLSVFSLVLFIAFAVWRQGRAGGAIATLAVAIASVAATMQGIGPFSKPLINDSLVSLDGFLMLCAAAGLLLSVANPCADRERGKRVRCTLPAVTLLAGVAATLGAWHFISLAAEQRTRDSFLSASGEIEEYIRERMDVYLQTLRGARGLFEASPEDVKRSEWQRYVASLELERNYPGILAVGFARPVASSELRAFVRSARASGVPDYSLRPSHPRETYTAIVFAEPQDARNRMALGYDMYSEEVRREAMARARDSGQPALSGPVTLVQEIDSDQQPGALLYVPLYRAGAPVATVEQRRSALLGWVYSPFRMHDLMRAILGARRLPYIATAIYDGNQPERGPQLYADPAFSSSAYPHQMRAARTLSIGGHEWTVVTKSTPELELQVDTGKAQVAIIAGSLISMLLFGVLRAMANTREEALALAEHMSFARAEAERRYQSLAESASQCILVVNHANEIVFGNRAATELFGLSVERLKQHRLADMLELPPGFGAWLKCAARGIPCTSFQTSARNSAGTAVPVEVSMSGWMVGAEPTFGLVLQDLRASLAAKEGLRRARAELRSILENMPAMVGSWDAQLRNRYCNAEYRDWFGVEPESVRGLHIREVLGDQLYELNRPHIEAALQGQAQSFERVIRSPDGRVRHAQAYYLPDVEEGQVQGFFVLVFDITRQKEVEQALHQREVLLNAAREAAEGAAKTKAAFLANMSHEIRTPMNAVLGMTRLTLDTPLSDEQRHNLEMAENAAVSLLRILDDILDFSKIEAGKLTLSDEPFDVRNQTASTLHQMVASAQAKGLELLLDVSPNVPERVTGDCGRLMQVLTNLVSNAIKFTEKGHVLCSVSLQPHDGQGCVLAFTVEDTGCGIAPDARSRIFDSFVQADNSVTRAHGGTGLGLAICRQIVSLMGGSITVESELGRGTQFVFTASFSEATPPPAMSAEDAALLGGLEAWVVIREPVAAGVVRRAMTEFSASTTCCATPIEALAAMRAARSRQPQATLNAPAPAVLLVEAPLWDDTAARALRHVGQAAVVLIVGTTGCTTSLEEVGATLRQPLRRVELMRGLRQALGAARSPVPLQDAPHSKGGLPASTRMLNVLLAEDHPVNRELARRVLEARGHKLTLVEDGARAVAATLDEHFDVIVMDVQMPVLDGVAATRQIREREVQGGTRVPILALTAHALVGEREWLLQCGMDDHLAKPYQPAELVRRVEQLASNVVAGVV